MALQRLQSWLFCHEGAHAVEVAGSYAFGEHINFYRCPRGHYCPKGPRSIPCPPGAFNNRVGAESYARCQRCPDDMYNDKPGQNACKLCSASSIPLYSVHSEEVCSTTSLPKRKWIQVRSGQPLANALVNIANGGQELVHAYANLDMNGMI